LTVVLPHLAALRIRAVGVTETSTCYVRLHRARRHFKAATTAAAEVGLPLCSYDLVLVSGNTDDSPPAAGARN
jgi:hypothetical protein